MYDDYGEFIDMRSEREIESANRDARIARMAKEAKEQDATLKLYLWWLGITILFFFVFPPIGWIMAVPLVIVWLYRLGN